MNTYLLVYLIGVLVTTFLLAAAQPKQISNETLVAAACFVVIWPLSVPITTVVFLGEKFGKWRGWI